MSDEDANLVLGDGTLGNLGEALGWAGGIVVCLGEFFGQARESLKGTQYEYGLMVAERCGKTIGSGVMVAGAGLYIVDRYICGRDW